MRLLALEDSRQITQLPQHLSLDSSCIACCRLKQSVDGKYFVDSEGVSSAGIPCTVATLQHLHISDLPAHYVQAKVSDAVPVNTLVPELIPQMQPHLMLAGKEPLFKLQLTHVRNGSVLGVSFSHALAGLSHTHMLWQVTHTLTVAHANTHANTNCQ